MVHSQFSDGRGYLFREYGDAVFVRDMRQDHEALIVVPRDDIAGTLGAASYRLTYATQARISRMAAEYLQVGAEIVKCQHHQCQRTLFASGDGPIVIEYVAKCGTVQQTGYGIVARQITNAALGLEQFVLNLGISRVNGT